MSDSPRDDSSRNRRGHWPVRLFSLQDQPGDDLSAVTTPRERIAMLWPLTLEAWELAGSTIPDYPRDRTPVRVIDASES